MIVNIEKMILKKSDKEMKRIIFCIVSFLGFASGYFDVANAMLVPRNRSMYSPRANSDVLDRIGLSPKIENIIISALNIKSLRVLTMILGHTLQTIQRNLNFLDSEYINNYGRRLNISMRDMSSEDPQYEQLQELNDCLGGLLRCKDNIFNNDILRQLKVERNDIKHPFIDYNNPRMGGVLCMFSYIEKNALQKACEFFKTCADAMARSGSNNNAYKTLAKNLKNLLYTMNQVEDLTHELIPLDFFSNIQNMDYEERAKFLKSIKGLMQSLEYIARLAKGNSPPDDRMNSRERMRRPTQRMLLQERSPRRRVS
jgi:hypothetical protein